MSLEYINIKEGVKFFSLLLFVSQLIAIRAFYIELPDRKVSFGLLIIFGMAQLGANIAIYNNGENAVPSAIALGVTLLGDALIFCSNLYVGSRGQPVEHKPPN